MSKFVLQLNNVDIQRLKSFKRAHTWKTLLAPEDQVNLHIRNEANTNLILTVDAPFYNDDPSTAAGPNPSLFNYEVVHFFLLNSNGEYCVVLCTAEL